MMPVFEWVKTVHALDHTAIVIGNGVVYWAQNSVEGVSSSDSDVITTKLLHSIFNLQWEPKLLY
jgi:hypothetical protein